MLNSLLLFMLLSSCKNTEENKMVVIDKFPEVQSIQGTPVENIELFSGGNVNLVVVDSFLVVQKKEDNFFHIYSTTTHELLAKVGSEGRGPNEFNFPELLNQVSHDKINNSPIVNIYDYDRRRFSELNILNAINQSDTIFNHKPIPNIDKYLTYFFYMDNDMLIAAPENEGRFVIKDENKSEYQIIPYIPATDFHIDEEVLPMVYRSASFINKDLGLMASAPILLGELDFFDLEGKHVKSVEFESRDDLENELAKNIRGNGNIKYHIADIDAKGGFIYCLNYNNSSEVYERTADISDLKIQVFDWDGNPIKEFILADNRFISSFAYDEINNRFYGYCGNEEEHTIISYDLGDQPL